MNLIDECNELNGLNEITYECSVSLEGSETKPTASGLRFSVRRLVSSDLRDFLGRGYTVIPCRRKIDACSGKGVQMVFFDIDDSPFTASDFVKFLDMKPSLWYDTFSSVPGERNRFRLVYLFDRAFPSENYGDVYDWILGREKIFAGVSNDTHSRTPYQMEYGTDKEVFGDGFPHPVPDFVPSYYEEVYESPSVDDTDIHGEDFAKTVRDDFAGMGFRDFVSKYDEVYGREYGPVLYESRFEVDPADERIERSVGPYYRILVPWSPSGKRTKWHDGQGRHSKLFVNGVKWRHIYGDIVTNEFMLYLVTKCFLECCTNEDGRFTKREIRFLARSVMLPESFNRVKPDGPEGKWRINKRYCKEMDIPTRGLLTILRNELSCESRKAKVVDKYKEFDKYCDAGKTIAENIAVMASHGVEVKYGVMQRYLKAKRAETQ